MEILHLLVNAATTLISRYDAIEHSDSRARRLREYIGELQETAQSVQKEQQNSTIFEDEKYRRLTENLNKAFEESSDALNEWLDASTIHKIRTVNNNNNNNNNNNKIKPAEDRLQQALSRWQLEMQLATLNAKNEFGNRSQLQRGIKLHVDMGQVITAEWLLEQPHLREFFARIGEPGIDAVKDCRDFKREASEEIWQRCRDEYEVNSRLTPKKVEKIQRILLHMINCLKESISSLVELKHIDNDEEIQLRKILDLQSPLVENLSSRFVVLGPMNAGKSTLINAIVGMEVCPSHSTASTAIPCIIRHSPQPIDPTLEVDLKLFTDAIKAIHVHATKDLESDQKNADDTRAAEVLDQEVEDTRKQIISQTFTIPESKTTGVENCHKTLKTLNHILRLCIYYKMEPPVYSTLLCPIMNVHFTSLSDVDIVGIFEIVDSPGLAEGNETRMLQIEEVIRELIRSSTASFVILACDILQLSVTQKVIQTLIKSGNELDKTYVIGNKFDPLQTSGDFETPAQRERFRKNISDSIINRPNAIERVYLTSASYGLLAIRFANLLRENVRNGKQERPEINFDSTSWKKKWPQLMWRARSEHHYMRQDPDYLVELNKELFEDSHISEVQDLMIKKLAPDSALHALSGAAYKIYRRFLPASETCTNRANLFRLTIDQINNRIEKNKNELKIIHKCLETWFNRKSDLTLKVGNVTSGCYQKLKANVRQTIDDTLAPVFRQNRLEVVVVTKSNYIEQGLLESDIGHRVIQYPSKKEAKEALETIRSIIEISLEDVFAEFNSDLTKSINQVIRSHAESLENDFKQSLDIDDSVSAHQVINTIRDRTLAIFESTKSDLLKQAIAQGVKRRKHWYTFWLKEHIHKMKNKFVIRQQDIAIKFKDSCFNVIDVDTIETKNKGNEQTNDIQETLRIKIDQRLTSVQQSLTVVQHSKEEETSEGQIKHTADTTCLALELEFIIDDLKFMLKFLEHCNKNKHSMDSDFKI